MPSDTSTTLSQTADSNGSSNRLQDAAGDVIDQAGRTAERQASSAMTRASNTLDDVARAVRDSGGQLREQRPEIANVAETAAQRVEGVSNYLREHDAPEILDEAKRLAQRQPALVVGGGLLLGLIAGRILRSGAEPMSPNRSPYWSGESGSYPGASGWSGGSSADMTTSRPAGTSLPGNGYGTGYGASYDKTVDGRSANGLGTLSGSDATATGGSSTDKTTSTSSKRRTGSTGQS